MPENITIDEVNRLDRDEFVSRFGALFERSPWVAKAAWHESPFADLSRLHEAFVRAMHEAPQERQLALIRAHPDLVGKAAVAGGLTAESAEEQASAGLNRLSPEEYEAFTSMNAAYREKFGFPMIVCVREHDKASILRNARNRLENTYEEEFGTALTEISKIADLRLRDLVEDGEVETNR